MSTMTRGSLAGISAGSTTVCRLWRIRGCDADRIVFYLYTHNGSALLTPQKFFVMQSFGLASMYRLLPEIPDFCQVYFGAVTYNVCTRALFH